MPLTQPSLLSRAPGSGMTYDAAGNLTYDGYNHYTYDAEGRILTVNTTGSAYVYDAQGHRGHATYADGTFQDFLFGPNARTLLTLNTAGGLNTDPAVMKRVHDVTMKAVAEASLETVRARLEWLMKIGRAHV